MRFAFLAACVLVMASFAFAACDVGINLYDQSGNQIQNNFKVIRYSASYTLLDAAIGSSGVALFSGIAGGTYYFEGLNTADYPYTYYNAVIYTVVDGQCISKRIDRAYPYVTSITANKDCSGNSKTYFKPGECVRIDITVQNKASNSINTYTAPTVAYPSGTISAKGEISYNMPYSSTHTFSFDYALSSTETKFGTADVSAYVYGMVGPGTATRKKTDYSGYIAHFAIGECSNGDTSSQSCTVSGCAGTQTRSCSGNTWGAYGTCTKTDKCCGVTCTPPGECWTSSCSAGSCSNTPKASGTTCSIGKCDSSGNCKAVCTSGQDCKDASTLGLRNTDCSWSNLVPCTYGCSNKACNPTPSGCQYNNPACDSTHTCVSNQCVLKSGCAYSNPACDSNHTCTSNQCVLKSGCAYGNPACGAGYGCVNNQCVQNQGCAYNNPACDSNHTCTNNQCVLNSGCAYGNPACGANYNCVSNQCILKSGCAYLNPACGAGYGCVNNVCVQTDACANVTCNSPPNTECYASAGTCSAGNCSYSPKAAGTSCLGGACDGKGFCKQAPNADPTRISPTSGQKFYACSSASVAFSWYPVSTASYYWLYVYYGNGSTAFTKNVSEVVSGKLTHAASIAVGDNYAWNLRACNEAGCRTGTMDGFSVLQDGGQNCVPGTVSPLSPADGALVGLNVNLTWSAVAGATSYFLTLTPYSGAATNYSITNAWLSLALQPGKYTWYVGACNKFGCNPTAQLWGFEAKGNQCSAGECCDVAQGLFRSAGSWCGQKTYEYSCSGTAPGNSLVNRFKQPACTGSSATCNSAVSWSDWNVSKQCGAKEYCDSATQSCKGSCLQLNVCYDANTLGVQTADCKIVSSNFTCKSGCEDGACKGDTPVISNLVVPEPIYAGSQARFTSTVVDGEENIKTVIFYLKSETGLQTIAMSGGGSSHIYYADKAFAREDVGSNITCWIEAVDANGKTGKSVEKNFVVEVPQGETVAVLMDDEAYRQISYDCYNGNAGACDLVFNNATGYDSATKKNALLSMDQTTNMAVKSGSAVGTYISTSLTLETEAARQYYKTKNFYRRGASYVKMPAGNVLKKDIVYYLDFSKGGLQKRTSWLPDEISKLGDAGGAIGVIALGFSIISDIDGKDAYNASIILAADLATNIGPDLLMLSSKAGVRAVGGVLAGAQVVLAGGQIGAIVGKFVVVDVLQNRDPVIVGFADDMITALDPAQIVICAVTSGTEENVKKGGALLTDLTRVTYKNAAHASEEELQNITAAEQMTLMEKAEFGFITCLMPNMKTWAPSMLDDLMQMPGEVVFISSYFDDYLAYSRYGPSYGITLAQEDQDLIPGTPGRFTIKTQGMFREFHALPTGLNPQDIVDYLFSNDKMYRVSFGWQIGIKGDNGYCNRSAALFDRTKIDLSNYPNKYSESFTWTPPEYGDYPATIQLLWMWGNGTTIVDSVCGQNHQLEQKVFAYETKTLQANNKWIIPVKLALINKLPYEIKQYNPLMRRKA